MLTILGIALIVCLAGILFWLWWLVRYLLVIHPQQERDCIELFSIIAISDTLARYPYLNELEQRQKAEERLRELFDERGLTLTGDTLICASIGWAIHKKLQEEQKLDIEKLKAEISKAGIDKKTTNLRLPAIRSRKVLAAPYTPKLLPSGDFIL